MYEKITLFQSRAEQSRAEQSRAEQSRAERNYGIDGLRIVAMFMIVLLHTLGHGGILGRVVPMSAQWLVAWFLEIFAYGAVNCYALISGYVGYQVPFRLSRLFRLWGQVAFYTITITGIFYFFVPNSVGVKTWINSVFPVIRGHYWYISAYFGIFFFMPLMNKLLEVWSYREFKYFFGSVLVAYVILPTLLLRDTLEFKGGYSAFWLLVLYIVGGGLAKFNVVDRISGKFAIWGFWLMTFMTWLSMVVIYHGSMLILGNPKGIGLLISYTSPTVFVGSILLTLYFARKMFDSTVLRKLIGLFAPATLGVYLIHEHSLVRNYFVNGFAVSFAEHSCLLMMGEVLGSALLIYVGCSLIEILRIKLFEVFRVLSFFLWDKLQQNQQISITFRKKYSSFG